MGALAQLFGEERAKGTKVTTKPAKATAKAKVKPAKSSDGRKKVCSKCGSEVWAMHTKEGLCKACQAVTSAKAKTAKATPAKRSTTTGKETTMARRSKLRASKEIKATDWHDKEPSFAQTSRLKNETGRLLDEPNLKTWGLEMTRLEASELISMCADGNQAEVREILINDYDAPLWKSKAKPGKSTKKAKTASTRKVETKPSKAEPADPPEEDYVAIIAALKKKAAGLKGANTRLINEKNAREEAA